MHEQRTGSQEAFDQIDADAVCEQCSTVNPAGTLLCKTCGNNLRDQRMRRLAADEGMDVVQTSVRPRRVLTGLLVIMGLLAVLWAGINVGNVEAWLTNRITTTQSGVEVDPAQFWTGSDAAIYDAMTQELRENPITDAEASAAPVAGNASEVLDGRYIIRSISRGSRIIGSALVQTHGSTTYFIAVIGLAIELRGKVPAGQDGQFEAQEIGVQWGYDTYDAYGVARAQPDGTFTCAGIVSNSSDQSYSAMVYRVPTAP